MKNYDPQQWNLPEADEPFVRIEDLGAAAVLFPPVSEPCSGCNGEGQIYISQESQVQCDACGGVGRTVREMDAREEHFYIMYLLNKKGIQ